ncbi:MAG: hypothetical protein ACYDA2_03775 [Acidimicrobiales bacterium]
MSSGVTSGMFTDSSGDITTGPLVGEVSATFQICGQATSAPALSVVLVPSQPAGGIPQLDLYGTLASVMNTASGVEEDFTGIAQWTPGSMAQGLPVAFRASLLGDQPGGLSMLQIGFFGPVPQLAGSLLDALPGAHDASTNPSGPVDPSTGVSVGDSAAPNPDASPAISPGDGSPP